MHTPNSEQISESSSSSATGNIKGPLYLQSDTASLTSFFCANNGQIKKKLNLIAFKLVFILYVMSTISLSPLLFFYSYIKMQLGLLEEEEQMFKNKKNSHCQTVRMLTTYNVVTNESCQPICLGDKAAHA